MGEVLKEYVTLFLLLDNAFSGGLLGLAGGWVTVPPPPSEAPLAVRLVGTLAPNPENPPGELAENLSSRMSSVGSSRGPLVLADDPPPPVPLWSRGLRSMLVTMLCAYNISSHHITKANCTGIAGNA